MRVPQLQVLGAGLQVRQTAARVLQIERIAGSIRGGGLRSPAGHVLQQRSGIPGAGERSPDFGRDRFDRGRVAAQDAGPRQRHQFRGRRRGATVAELVEGVDGRLAAARRGAGARHLIEPAVRGAAPQVRDQLPGRAPVEAPRVDRLRAGGLSVSAEVGHEPQVQVGLERHLSGAELAQGHHRAAAWHRPVTLLQPGDRIAKQHVDDHGGDVRQRGGRLVDRNEILQRLDADLEPAVAGPGGHLLDPRRGIPPALQALVEVLRQPLSAGERQKERGVQHGLQEPRIGSQDIGHARRAAHHDGDEVEEPRVGSEHGEERDVLRQGRQEAVHAVQGAVRVGRLAHGVDDLVQYLPDDGARPFRAGRRVASFGPSPEGLDGGERLRESGRLQLGDRVRILVRSLQDRGRDVLLGLRGVEPRAIEVVDLRGGALDPVDQIVLRVEPEEGGDVRQPFVGLRKLLGLGVVDHLQAVLDPPQQQVRVAQGGRLARHDVVLAVERLQHGKEARAAQAAVAAPVRQLMHVHEELDLADAAAAELHVMAGCPDRSMAVEVVDLLAHGADFLHRGEVQPLVPDERREPFHERRAGRQVAGDRPGLDQRGPLPGAPEALVVVHGEVDGDGDRGRRWIGAEPQVGAEDVAVAGAGLQDADQILRDAHEAVAQGPAAGVADRFRVVHDDQVDVGRVVQLARAVLAHRQDEVPPPFPGRRFQVAPLDPVEEQVGRGQTHRVIRHVGEQLRAVHDAADAEAVVHRGDHGHAVAPAAQEGHQTVAVHGRVRAGKLAAHAIGEGVRRLLDERLGELRVALQQEAQVRAVAEQEREEGPAGLRVERRAERVPPLAGSRVAQPVDARFGLIRAVRAQRIEPGRLGRERQNGLRAGFRVCHLFLHSRQAERRHGARRFAGEPEGYRNRRPVTTPGPRRGRAAFRHVRPGRVWQMLDGRMVEPAGDASTTLPDHTQRQAGRYVERTGEPSHR